MEKKADADEAVVIIKNVHGSKDRYYSRCSFWTKQLIHDHPFT
jgi:hypothetical protein